MTHTQIVQGFTTGIKGQSQDQTDLTLGYDMSTPAQSKYKHVGYSVIPIWRILGTFRKISDLFSIKGFEIDPFTNQAVNFLMFYDNVDIFGHFQL